MSFIEKKEIRYHISNSRIDNMYLIYKFIKEEYEERGTDTIDSQELFKAVIKKSKGVVSPYIIKRELELI